MPIQAVFDILILRAELRNDPMSRIRTIRPSRVWLDDDVVELFRLDQPAERRERDLRLLPRADRLLPDLPTCDLLVLIAHRVDHVAGVQVHPGQPGRDRPRFACCSFAGRTG